MDLKTIELGDRGAGSSVLITGGVHGDEYEPMVAIDRLGKELRDRRLKGHLRLVPVVNEAAYRLGRRTAEDGQDLARTCPGRAEGTVTEGVAQALAALIRQADAYLDLHTGGGNLRLLPLCGYMMHPAASVRERQRRMARVFGMPVVWGTDPNLEGRSLSVARDAGVPAIYAEFLGGGGCDGRGVEGYLQGCRNVLIDLGLIAGEIVLPEAEPLVVEDERPGSGHLQVQHPAARDGIFEVGRHAGGASPERGSVGDPGGPDRGRGRAGRGGTGGDRAGRESERSGVGGRVPGGRAGDGSGSAGMALLGRTGRSPGETRSVNVRPPEVHKAR